MEKRERTERRCVNGPAAAGDSRSKPPTAMEKSIIDGELEFVDMYAVNYRV